MIVIVAVKQGWSVVQFNAIDTAVDAGLLVLLIYLICHHKPCSLDIRINVGPWCSLSLV